MNVDPRDYDIHINFPGGVPIDGPSAGVTMATAIYSAIKNIPVDNTVAMTGEVSVRGYVKPVGGIVAKVEAARQAGVKTVFISAENYQDIFKEMRDIEVVPVERLEEIIERVMPKLSKDKVVEVPRVPNEMLSAYAVLSSKPTTSGR
jgi:Lon-like ATP-dependent protease